MSGACECPHLEFAITGKMGHTMCLAACSTPPLMRDGANGDSGLWDESRLGSDPSFPMASGCLLSAGRLWLSQRVSCDSAATHSAGL